MSGPGDSLAAAIRDSGMSLRQVSEASGVSRSTINRMVATGDGMLYSWRAVSEAMGLGKYELLTGYRGGPIDDAEKVRRVDKWLEDVSDAARRWKTAKSAQQASERVVAYLKEIKSHMHGAPADLNERMDEAIAKNEANAERLAEEASRQADLESGFYAVLPHVGPSEVAEAWRMRCTEGKTWAQCSMALHYNRTHLERLSKKAKLDAYDMMPGEYR